VSYDGWRDGWSRGKRRGNALQGDPSRSQLHARSIPVSHRTVPRDQRPVTTTTNPTKAIETAIAMMTSGQCSCDLEKPRTRLRGKKGVKIIWGTSINSNQRTLLIATGQRVLLLAFTSKARRALTNYVYYHVSESAVFWASSGRRRRTSDTGHPGPTALAGHVHPVTRVAVERRRRRTATAQPHVPANHPQQYSNATSRTSARALDRALIHQ